MSGILQPGYVRWDGTKFVLDDTLQGPQGVQGVQGATGPAGPAITIQNAGTVLSGSPFPIVNLLGGLSAANAGGGVAALSPPVNDNTTSVTTSPYTVGLSEIDLLVNTSALAITINLPASPATGRRLVIIDASGQAATRNITLQGNGKNINGSSSLVLNTNFTVKTLIYSGTFWNAF